MIHYKTEAIGHWLTLPNDQGHEVMEHQWEGADASLGFNERAFYMEMGTGKTLTSIIAALYRFYIGDIDRVLIVCPTPIKQVWEDELNKFITDDGPNVSWFTNMAGNRGLDKWIAERSLFEEKTLHFLIVGVESFSQGHAAKKVEKFCNDRTMMIIDESSTIKKHGRPNGRKFYGSRRTYNCYQLGGRCQYRVIMTGTEITQGLHDLFSQFYFLNAKIVGMRSWTAFRNRYCILNYFDGIDGYQNESELLDAVRPYVYQKKKSEVLDLPDKVYLRRYVEPTKEQTLAITQLDETMAAEQDGDVITATTHLERFTRYHQIIGGNFPFEIRDEDLNKMYETRPISGKNPKLEEVVRLLEDEVPSGAKVIIWARFMPELDQIVDRLGEDNCYQFHGGVGEDDRKQFAREFQNNPDSKPYMVANPAVGGMGQTWTAATYTIYYSCGFSWGDRIQSEDRNHRKGQINKVTYIDIELNHKYDKAIHEALRRKQGLAQYVQENLSRGT